MGLLDEEKAREALTSHLGSGHERSRRLADRSGMVCPMNLPIEHVLLLRRVPELFEFKRLELKRQNPPTFYDIWEVSWAADAATRERDYALDENLIDRKQIKAADQIPRPLIDKSSEDSVLHREMELLLNEEVERLCQEGFVIKEDTRKAKR
jgi:hypothetical protein